MRGRRSRSLNCFSRTNRCGLGLRVSHHGDHSRRRCLRQVWLCQRRRRLEQTSILRMSMKGAPTVGLRRRTRNNRCRHRRFVGRDTGVRYLRSYQMSRRRLRTRRPFAYIHTSRRRLRRRPPQARQRSRHQRGLSCSNFGRRSNGWWVFAQTHRNWLNIESRDLTRCTRYRQYLEWRARVLLRCSYPSSRRTCELRLRTWLPIRSGVYADGRWPTWWRAVRRRRSLGTTRR